MAEYKATMRQMNQNHRRMHILLLLLGEFLWPWQLSNYFSTHVARKKRLMIQNHRLLLLGGLLVEIGLELFIGECGGVRGEDATDELESSSEVLQLVLE